MKPAFGNREKTTLMRLQFSIGLTSNPRTWPVIDGQVTPDAIDRPHGPAPLRAVLAAAAVRRVRRRRNVGVVADDGEVQGRRPLRRHPGVHHAAVLSHRNSRPPRRGIETPADLKGKRVGVPEYQQTAALWARGVLQHEFGVAPKDMEFWMERPPSHSHGGATGFVPPPGVTVNRIPLDKNIGSMMLAGELDAVLFYLVDPNLIDRSTATSRVIPTSRPCFPIRWPKASATIARPASTPSTMAW